MLLSNGILTNEVLRWKAIGAAVWLAAITVAMSAAWSLAAAPTTLLLPLRLLSGLFSPSGWLAAAALVLAQAPAFVAQVGALQGSDPKPSHALRLQRLGAAAVVVSKLAARCSSALGAARTTSFLGLHVLSAMMFLGIDSATRSAAPQGGWVQGQGESREAGCSLAPGAALRHGIAAAVAFACRHVPCGTPACGRTRSVRSSCGACLLHSPMPPSQLSALPAGATWTLLYGLWLAGLYLLHWAYWCALLRSVARCLLAFFCCYC